MTLAVENLHAAYGEIEVLHGVNLAVEKGQIIALLGANGAGKSTTIKAIMGLVKPSAGRILLDGRDLSGQACASCRPRRHRAGSGGPQDFQEDDGRGEPAGRRRGAQRPPRCASSLPTSMRCFRGSAERRRQVGGTLSGGEQQMLAIGRALMSRPRLHPDGRAVARSCAARGRERAPGDRPDPPRDGHRRHPGRAECRRRARRSRPTLTC